MEIEWTKENKFQVKGNSTRFGDVGIFDGIYKVSLNGFPSGTILYERRTGKVLQKKIFPPNKECPMFALRHANENKTDSSIPTKEINAWLKTQVKG